MCKQSSIHAAGESVDCSAKESSHASELHCIGDGLRGKADSHIMNQAAVDVAETTDPLAALLQPHDHAESHVAAAG